jgi:hypothetical protein
VLVGDALALSLELLNIFLLGHSVPPCS